MRRVMLLAAVAWAVAAPSAYAGGLNGLLVSTPDWNCYSLTTGHPYMEPMISGIVGWASTGEMPAGGEIFNAQLSVGVVGTSCSGAYIVPSVIPPLGVRVAADAAHPVQWRYPDTSQTWQTSGYKLLPLPDGSTKIIADTADTTWPIANDQAPLQFLIPIVADRALSGAGSAPGQCPNGPPCAPSEAGDYLQVKIDTSIGNPTMITPVVQLFATAPPPGTPPPTPPGTTPLPAAASKLSAPSKATLAKGVKVKVQAATGAKLALTLTAKGKLLARGSATAKAGTTTVTLKRTTAGKKVKGTVKATLKLVATGTGLTKFEKTATVRVRR